VWARIGDTVKQVERLRCVGRVSRPSPTPSTPRPPLDITVCHYPPGTSKWNKVEHRLFSFISTNWRGRPLTDYQVIVETIAATTTETGLTVEAVLDTNTYPTGMRISKAQMKTVPISRHDFHGEWNYCIHSGQTLETVQIRQ
jgi:hypothetical protein